MTHIIGRRSELMNTLMIDDDIIDELLIGITEPSDEEIKRISTPSLKNWNMVICSRCRKAFDITRPHTFTNDGNLRCPHCKHIN